jgi:NAD(P)H-hydrate epimerase
VLIIAGSLNYIGAAYLACQGAARVGAGLVTLATPHSIYPILASKLTEVTHIPLPETEPGFIGSQALEVLGEWLPRYDAFLIGCGLGQRGETEEFLHSLLPCLKNKPVVLDADALNILAKRDLWWQEIQDNIIITPHPAEMSRLSRLPLEEIQRDRIEITRRAAQEWGKVVVLKGAHTVIASPKGNVFVSPFANPALASAGTGDVAAGAICGLLAQGLAPFEAAAAGVYLHGMAAEMVKGDIGEAGMLASDLLPNLPRVLSKVKQGSEEEYF